MFTLAADAAVDETDLAALQASHTRVLVEYEGEPNRASGFVRSIKEKQ